MDYNWGIISDIHLKLYNDSEYTESGIPLKLFEILEVFRNMCEYMRSKNISKVAILGDVNDTKQFAAVDAFSIFKKLLEDFSDINFYIIPGNHDMTVSNISKEMLNHDLRTAVDLLKGPKNIITIDEPTVIDNITFVPYQHINIINDLEPTDILMSHLGLSDAVLSNGRSIRNKFRSQDLKKWKLIFLGHYHKPQQLDNVYYIGSPIPLSRSEFDEDKRYICLNSETLDIESVNTTGYRKYYEVVINDTEDIKSKLDEANSLKENGNFVVVRNKTDQVINDNCNVKLINEFEPKFETRGISGRMSDEEQMRRYLEIERIPKEEVEEFLKIGLEIIN
jgi:DNA repair exonuclease SbcCD nuclease subunit